MIETMRCSQHPHERAGWTCSACGLDLCMRCAARRKAGTGYVVVCQLCGGFAPPIMVPRARTSFSGSLTDATLYPFSRNGLIMMAACGLVFGSLQMLGALGALVAAAAMISYLFLVVRSSASGHPDLPEAEDFTHIMELGLAFLKAVVALTLSVIPAVAYVFWIRPHLGRVGPVVKDPLTYVTVILGALWAPVSLILAATSSPFMSIINPVLAMRIVRRLGTDFLLCAALIWLVALAWWFLRVTGAVFARDVYPVPVLPQLITATMVMYPALVGSRILGNLLYTRGSDLDYGASQEHLEPALGNLLPPAEKVTQSPAPDLAPVELGTPEAFGQILQPATSEPSQPVSPEGPNLVPPETASPPEPPPAIQPYLSEGGQEDREILEAILGPMGRGSPFPPAGPGGVANGSSWGASSLPPASPPLPRTPPRPVTPAPQKALTPPSGVVRSPSSLPTMPLDWRSLPPPPRPESVPAPAPAAPISDSARTVVVSPPNDADIQDLARVGNYDAVANAYRARRGAVSFLTAEQLVWTAEAAMNHSDFQTAWHAYKRIGYDHPTAPDAPRALLVAGRILLDKMHKEQEGRKLLNHLIQAYPASPEAVEARSLLQPPAETG